MVSVRKRKMARSSVKKTTVRTKDKQRDIKVKSNPLIAANWDKSLTLQQNYKKLGLAVKLGRQAGGQEQKVETLTDYRNKRDAEAKLKRPSAKDIENTEDPSQIPEGEARIIRDPKTNAILRTIEGTMKLTPEEKPKEESKVVKQLEELAQKHALVKDVRKTSDREAYMLEKLCEKYGDDYEKMKWDQKLNPFQHSPGELRKRIAKWRKSGN